MDVYGCSPYFLRLTPFVKESIFLTVFRGQLYQVLLSMFSKIPSATLHIWHYFVYKHLIGVSYIVHKHRAGYFCII